MSPLGIGLGIAPRHLDGSAGALLWGRRPFHPIWLTYMDGIALQEQVLQWLGQRLPGKRLTHPNSVAAMGRNNLRGQKRARRWPFQEAEVSVPVAAKHTTRLIRLLENPNDLGIARQRLHIRQSHQRPAGRR